MSLTSNPTNFTDVAIGGSASVTGDLTVTGAITGNVDISSTLKFGDGEDIVDSNSNELIEFGVTASAVNEIKVTNAATGNPPSIKSQGGDTNVAMLLAGKGTGAVQLGQSTTVGVTLIADQPLLDSSANELVKFTKVASAVNEITIGNNSTGLGPTLTASGETNVPVTLAGKGTGYVGLGQSTSTDVRLVADQPIGDSSGNELIKFIKTTSAVNEVTVTNAAASGTPSITATGSDTNIAVLLAGKGTGAVQLGQSTSVGVTLVADQALLDSSANEYIKFSKTASAVNEITVTNAATGGTPSIVASGGDTNVNLALGGKGDGALLLHSTMIVIEQGTPTAKTTSTTLTAVELVSGIITVNQGAGGASALQLPLATDLDTALAFSAADDAFEFSLINISTNAAEDASITTNTGWTLVGNMDVASNAAATDKSAGRFLARKTGAGAWTLYRLS